MRKDRRKNEKKVDEKKKMGGRLRRSGRKRERWEED